MRSLSYDQAVKDNSVSHSFESKKRKPNQGRREKIRAPGQTYDAGPLGTKIYFSKKEKV